MSVYSFTVWFVGVLMLCCISAPAFGATGEPHWTVTAIPAPTNFVPHDESGDQLYEVIVTNTGSGASDGTPVVIKETLPPGIGLDPKGAFGADSLHGTQLECVFTTCTYHGVVIPDDNLSVSFPVDVEAGGVQELLNTVRVSGGGAPDAAVGTPTVISETPAKFGIAPGSTSVTLSTNQAGAHADLTTTLAFDTIRNGNTYVLAGDEKETVADLPPGFAGDLVDLPACQVALFSLQQCPISTQVGITTLTIVLEGRQEIFTTPVYNLSPNPGEVAKIGFHAKIFNVQGNVKVRSDYGLRTSFENITETAAELTAASLTIWGVPGASIHNPWRWDPNANGGFGAFGASAQSAVVPYLSNPTSCPGRPLELALSASSWERPDESVHVASDMGALGYCDRLSLPSTFDVQATTIDADAPTGLDAELTAQQTYENPEGLATSTLNKAVVTLPDGMTVNPAAGAGLSACNAAEYEHEDFAGPESDGCPNASKLGSVRIQTPSLREEATGSVYLATPYDNPFDSLLAVYIVARIPDRGVIVKSAGEVTADPLTGRLVTTFSDLPPLPFSHFMLNFRQGQTSPLVTPDVCGKFEAEAQLTADANLTEPFVELSPSFAVTQGVNGGACPSGGLPPFAVQMIAGTSNNSAGAFSPFSLHFTRKDGEQEITRFSEQLPAGLTARLTGVPFCTDSEIMSAREKTGVNENASPSCPASSQIGHTLVGVGVGATLVSVPGKLYFAGPYHGAPFSVVAITPSTVGPFDLGTVVVREALQINPTTAVVTIDGSASDPIPHILQGIVVHLRDLRVYVDREKFMLNPTNCNRMSFDASIFGSGIDFASSADDTTLAVQSPFQAANCQNLRFAPTLRASTSGKTSRAKGASLNVNLTYPTAAEGTQTNIRSVKVALPKQLPSRLGTLQQACEDRVFESNPAECPAASRVGEASAVTPILPVPVKGPAYFVSHGGARFPELIIVLQGYGVRIDLHGETFISNAGITSSTFRTVPDQPVLSFSLSLPEGNFSALAAIRDLCKSKLRMPTAFGAQNGMTIHTSTPIAVSGCRKHGAKKAVRTRGR
ncbi:MAG TPA: hypothetical protein VGI26_01960 [Solirubrobacteraceae bacterium]|jgi:hypothetical protein